MHATPVNGAVDCEHRISRTFSDFNPELAMEPTPGENNVIQTPAVKRELTPSYPGREAAPPFSHKLA